MSFHAPISRSVTDASDAPLAQSPAFAAALTHIGQPPLRLTLQDGAGPVQLIRRQIGPVTLGLVSRRDLRRKDITHLRREAGLTALILNAETLSGAHGVPLQTAASVAEWDLAEPEEALRAGLKQKWRNRLNKAERSRLKVAETRLDPARPHWIFEREGAQAKARGYANWSEGLTRAYAAANRGHLRLFEVRASGDAIAAMVFLTHGTVATYHMGWTSGEGRALCAHHLLLWHAALRLRARGSLRLDLGTVATDRAPGLARFKLGTGARLKILGGTWGVLPAFLRA